MIDNVIRQLQALGYTCRVNGEDIQLTWMGQGIPDPGTVRPLLQELRAKKPEAIDCLRALRVASMPLEDFSRGFMAVRVWSETFRREVWLVSTDREGKLLGADGVMFTGQELARLLFLHPTPRDLQTIVEAKELFHAKLVEGE